MKNKTDEYTILRVFAFAAALVASVATYDIAYSFAPDIVVQGVNLRPFIAGLYGVLLDGLYLLLDNRLSHMKTAQAREWTVRFMVLVWLIMASVNVTDAFLHKTVEASILGKAGVVFYVLKIIALLYLAWYTFIHYDDPDTQKEIAKRQSTEAMANGVNKYIGDISEAFGKTGAMVIAMNEVADFIKAQTGTHPREIFGKQWRSEMAELAGLEWKYNRSGTDNLGEIVEGQDKEQDAGNPDSPTSSGKGTGLREMIKNIPEVIRSKAQRVNTTSNASSTGSPETEPRSF